MTEKNNIQKNEITVSKNVENFDVEEKIEKVKKKMSKM